MPGFPTMGGMELLIILAIVLLFFGARRVPELSRSLGRSMREFRKATSEDSDEAELRERKENEQLSPQEETRSTEPEEADAGKEEDSRVERSPR